MIDTVYEAPGGRRIRPVDIGALLYVPATHRKLRHILSGAGTPGAAAIAVCLEDAVLEADIPFALQNLEQALTAASERNAADRPLVFVRPRGLGMAAMLAARPALRHAQGFVAPKFRAGHAERWKVALGDSRLLLMPTLETREIFRQPAVLDIAAEVLQALPGRVPLMRMGGNDLLSALGLRRARAATFYEGPLAYTASMLISTLVPMGIHLSAPVFEVMARMDVLAEECRRDVEWGFCGKTVIHPGQVATVHEALKVSALDLDEARRILARDAPAVFASNGAMCEPATHANWARGILARAGRWGIAGQPAAEIVDIHVA